MSNHASNKSARGAAYNTESCMLMCHRLSHAGAPYIALGKSTKIKRSKIMDQSLNTKDHHSGARGLPDEAQCAREE